MPPPPIAEADATAPVADFEEAVARYGDAVYARCRRSLQPADADDAVQAVFWILHRRWEQARSRPALIAWLLRTADLVVRNARRDERRRQRREQLVAHATPIDTVDAPLPEDDAARLRTHLDDALAALPAREREALALHYLAGHSLQEVATLSAAGLSTVKDRLQRGAEKLRAALLRQGVACSAAAVAQALGDATALRMPRTLQEALHHPPLTLPPRLRRWTRHGATMTTLLSSLTTTIALVAIGLNGGLHGAHVDAPTPAAAEATAPALESWEDATAHLDPAHARTWLLLTLPSGRASADRLAHLPEIAFLPDQGKALIEALQTVRAGRLVIDIGSMSPPDIMRQQFELQRDLARLPAAERIGRQITAARAMIAQSMQQAKAQQAHPDQVPLNQLHLPFLQGALELSAAEMTGRSPLEHLLGLVPRLQRQGNAFVLQLGGRTMTATLAPSALMVASTGADAPPAWPNPALLAQLPMPTGDLILQGLLDPGNGSLAPGQSLLLQLTPNGLHLTSDSPLPYVDASAPPSPKLDRRCFHRVPADAMLAGALALTPASTAASPTFGTVGASCDLLFHTVLANAASPKDPTVVKAQAVLHGCLDLLRTVDGTVLCYLQPGPMLPVVTLEVDCPKAAADHLLALIGEPLSEDGILHVGHGMQSLTLGWRDGRLVLTSNPQGLPEPTTTASFADTPEIRAAEQALPQSQEQSLLLLRPAATVSSLGWCVGLAAPTLAAALPGYQRSLATQEPYAYLEIAPSASSVHVEASGLLSFLAAAAIAAELRAPQGHG